MFYREAGQFKTSYAADMAVFPIAAGPHRHRRDPRRRLRRASRCSATTSLINAVMIPFLVFSLAAIGLNLLTGYTGLLSLGTGGFMGVGAYACYKLTTLFPDVNILVWILASGFFSAAVGALFGLPSLRIKGFYLAVATLAAQFFLQWCFVRVPWLYNYNVLRRDRGAARAPCSAFRSPARPRPPSTRYLVVLSIVVVLTWIASNLVHGRIGRMWMAVRDMDIAAELIGIRLLHDQAARLRGVVVLLRRRRRADGVPSGTAAPKSEVFNINQSLLHPVHGHHRRARQPDRLVLRRGAHLHPADRPAGGAGALGLPLRAATVEHLTFMIGRRADHLLPDRRAARPRPPVADRQAEAEGLAVPLLKGKLPIRRQIPAHARRSGPVADKDMREADAEPSAAAAQRMAARGRRIEGDCRCD